MKTRNYVKTVSVIIQFSIPRDINYELEYTMQNIDGFFSVLKDLYHAEDVRWITSGVFEARFRTVPLSAARLEQIETICAELFRNYLTDIDGERPE